MLFIKKYALFEKKAFFWAFFLFGALLGHFFNFWSIFWGIIMPQKVLKKT
jgi:hypothetical protein